MRKKLHPPSAGSVGQTLQALTGSDRRCGEKMLMVKGSFFCLVGELEDV